MTGSGIGTMIMPVVAGKLLQFMDWRQACACFGAMSLVLGVIAHQMVIATVACTLAGRPLSAWREHGLPNVGFAVLSWDGKALRLVDGSCRPVAVEGTR